MSCYVLVGHEAASNQPACQRNAVCDADVPADNDSADDLPDNVVTGQRHNSRINGSDVPAAAGSNACCPPAPATQYVSFGRLCS